MKKSISIILAVILAMSTIFVGCTAKNKEEKKNKEELTTEVGLNAAENEFAIDTVEVTDENGEKVTDKNGEVVTSEVYVELQTDKKGTTIAYLIDTDGEHVTNKKGKDVTYNYTTVENTTTSADKNNKPSKEESNKDKSDSNDKKDNNEKTDNTNTTEKTDDKDKNDKTSTTSKNKKEDDIEPQLPSVPSTKPTTATTTMKQADEVGTTSSELTTIKRENEKVPSTNDTGKKVAFGEDQQIIKEMLEVPNIYNYSYENADGVPIELATHVAIWMLQRENFSTTSYASSTVVLDLFKYFAQTVVNFKTHCNDAGNENITYKSANDTFIVSSFEAPTHTVDLESIENLGNNNYYKVTAKVNGTKKAKKVVAIIQKNKLDSSLGFSIKALKWS